jgi:hypothetical protein
MSASSSSTRRRSLPLLGDADLPDGPAHRRALHRRRPGQHTRHVRLGHRRATAQPFPVAADPSEGYTDAEIEAAGYLSGTAYAHPEYSGFTDLADWNDVGVIVLDEPVVGIDPAEVAPLGYLDQVAQPALNRTIVEVVGYGPKFASRSPARRSRSRRPTR